MFVLTARFPRWKLLALAFSAVLFLLLIVYLFFGLRDSAPVQPVLADNQARADYLLSWGWEVRLEPVETFQVLLPDSLEEPYLSYNELQKSQGFDLSDSCGKQVVRYTYAVTNYPDRPDGVQANLYLCEGFPVAGDIIATGENGFQAGLAFPSAS
jgi:hypothetical protein